MKVFTIAFILLFLQVIDIKAQSNHTPSVTNVKIANCIISLGDKANEGISIETAVNSAVKHLQDIKSGFKIDRKTNIYVIVKVLGLKKSIPQFNFEILLNNEVGSMMEIIVNEKGKVISCRECGVAM